MKKCWACGSENLTQRDESLSRVCKDCKTHQGVDLDLGLWCPWCGSKDVLISEQDCKCKKCGLTWGDNKKESAPAKGD